MSVLSQDDYVKNHGLSCAFCQGSDLIPYTHETKFDLGDLVMRVECESCGAKYLERYVIAGWEPIKSEDSPDDSLI